MRVLFLTHSFNSLAQRLHVELTEAGHQVSVEFDINDATTEQAVDLFQPEVIVAPFLKRKIPPSVYTRVRCLIVHPGIVGDRGPSSLDWAIQQQLDSWGVTCIEAVDELDGGPVWAWETFPLRSAKKSSIYRNEVTEAAVMVVMRALDAIAKGVPAAPPASDIDVPVRGGWQPFMRQKDRAIDWQEDDTATVLAKINAADGVPGLLDCLAGQSCFLHDATIESRLRGSPGELLATWDGAVCRATRDGAVWIGHLRPALESGDGLKLPAVQVIGREAEALPDVRRNSVEPRGRRNIAFRVEDGVGFLEFEFYNGAMDQHQCHALREAFDELCALQPRVVILLGGNDFWSNGIHLNQIEVAESASDESWANINAMNDLAQAIITRTDLLTVSALRGNAGAGGVFLALSADRLWMRRGCVLNPHYKSMGNLYGSEYWTYLLPRRIGATEGTRLTQNRLPVGAGEALRIGLVDEVLAGDRETFQAEVTARAKALAASEQYPALVAAKRKRRQHDEAVKPLADYRAEELERMRLNFYGFDSSYHVARFHFVHKWPKSRTPVWLAGHRALRK